MMWWQWLAELFDRCPQVGLAAMAVLFCFAILSAVVEHRSQGTGAGVGDVGMACPSELPILMPNLSDEFFNYYLDPRPGLAGEALKDCIRMGVFDKPENVVWYLFVRIARENPELVRTYEELFGTNLRGRRVIQKILQQAGDDQTFRFLEACLVDPEFRDMHFEIGDAVGNWPAAPVDPMVRPVCTHADLDLLWCEFRATGSTEPVLRIIDVFEQPDRIRVKLQEWLNVEQAPGLRPWIGLAARKLIVRRLRTKLGIYCDLEQREILSPQDLDCHCTMSGMMVDMKRAVKFCKLLPFGLDDDDNVAFFKAAARWSLASHAREHAVVFELCEAEAGRRTGRCRTLLREITAHAALARRGAVS